MILRIKADNKREIGFSHFSRISLFHRGPIVFLWIAAVGVLPGEAGVEKPRGESSVRGQRGGRRRKFKFV